MKVAVFGFYNNLNQGDDYLQYCITRMSRTAGYDVVFLPHNLSPPPKQYLRQFDWIIIGGGGLVHSHHGIWANMSDWIRKSGCKVGVVGLGVNKLEDEKLKREVRYLVDFSSFFYVRDKVSKKIIDNNTKSKDKVRVEPDVSFMYPLEEKYTVKKNYKFALNLTAKSYNKKSYEPKKWSEEVKNAGSTVPFPLRMTKEYDKGVLERVLNCSIGHKFSLRPLEESSILVGARFHSLIFSSMLSTPFIAIAYDDKVERLCKEMGLQNLCLLPDEHYKLRKKIKLVESNYENLKNKIENYVYQQTEEAKMVEEKIISKMEKENKSVIGVKSWIKKKIRYIIKTYS